jgi:hypothetical protein
MARPSCSVWPPCCSLVAASLVVLAACAGEPTEPVGPLLIGTWGSPDAELIAIRAGAEVRLGCATIIIATPIPLSASNTFATRGRLDGSGAEVGQLSIVDVTGSLRDSQVSITAPSAAAADPVTYVLEAGVSRSPSELPECPL